MINHARTLLLNLPGRTKITGPYEEYIPADFISVKLPAAYSEIRNILFGKNAPRENRLIRTYELMTLLHGCELEEFVLSLDPRITYKVPGVAGTMHPRPHSLKALTDVVNALEDYTYQNVHNLFVGTDEKLRLFANLWMKHEQLQYKLGGLTLALIYQTEKARNDATL